MIDISELIKKIKQTVDTHNLGQPGKYARWLWQNDLNSRELGMNEYGCADAANILYTIGEFPKGESERVEWIHVLQGMQDAETGMFYEKTHHLIHTTAHCIAALELFDALPLYKLSKLDYLKDKENLYHFLDKLEWAKNPWPQSHQGAGLYAAMVLAEEVTPEWQNWYFEWFWNETDSESGFWRKDYVKRDEHPYFFWCLAASFHYLFNHEYAHRPLRYPEKMVDSCLDIYYNKNSFPLGKSVNFAEVDWIYCLNRSVQQCGYKYQESQQALKEFATNYIDYLSHLDITKDDGFNDLHALFGATCALAELQKALPGFIYYEKPLNLVLDRRPFI